MAECGYSERALGRRSLGGAREHLAQFFLQAAELLGEIGFREAQQLGGAMHLGTQFRDAAVYEALEVGEGGGQFRPDRAEVGRIGFVRHHPSMRAKLGCFANYRTRHWKVRPDWTKSSP